MLELTMSEITPDSTRRFALYLSRILKEQGFTKEEILTLQESSSPFATEKNIKVRQFYDDLKHLDALVPLVVEHPGSMVLGEYGQYRFSPAKEAGPGQEAFLPFLQMLLSNSSLFPFETRSWLKKIIQEQFHPHQESLKGKIHYQSQPVPRKNKPDWFETLVESWETRKTAVMEYKKPNGERKKFQIEPLLLLNLGGVWYLLADASSPGKDFYDHPLQFKLSRILTLKIPAEAAPYQNRWTEEWLTRQYVNVYGSNLGTGNFPEGVREVTLRFRKEAAVYAEENKFHPGQKAVEPVIITEKLEEKDIRVFLQVRYYEDAIRLALTWGGLVVPETPADFVEAYRDAVKILSSSVLR